CGQYYTSGNGHKFHVVHDMEGYYDSVLSYFRQCSTQVSIHYCINGKATGYNGAYDGPEGEITQMTSDANYAWHAYCWNTHSTGTEHEGFASNPAWYTEAMYQASAGLTRNLANKFGYAKDRNHVVSHGEGDYDFGNPGWATWAGPNLGIDPKCMGGARTDPGYYWDWTKYMGMVNGTSSTVSPSPAMINNPDGRLEIFAVGSDSALWHDWETGNNGPWSGWWSFGGSGITQIAAAKHADGRLETFVVAGGAVSSMYQAGSPLAWYGYQPFSGLSVTAITTATNADGRLEIFAIGSDTALWHRWETSINGPWSGWSQLGGSGFTQIAAGRHQDGRLEIFMVGAAGAVSSMYQAGSPLAWYGFQQFPGGAVTRIAAANNADGRLEIFGVGTDTALWHNWEISNNGSWAGWWSFGGSGITQLTVGKHLGGRLEVFVLAGSGGAVSSMYQSGSPLAWYGFSQLGGSLTSLAVGNHNDGRMELFGRGLDGKMYQMNEVSPNGVWSGGWNSYYSNTFK
ncbi:MAG: N-acetylmuramoyl-L-alanine amidase, partial [Limisphaerales bacterium]